MNLYIFGQNIIEVTLSASQRVVSEGDDVANSDW